MRLRSWLTVAMLVQPCLLGCTGLLAPVSSDSAFERVMGMGDRPFLGEPAGDFACDFDDSKWVGPKLLSGREPRYTPEALGQRVEGSVLAKCTLTTQGVVKDCHILKSLPHLDAAALEVLSSRRYSPMLHEGKPLEVQHVFTVRFRLPKDAPPPDAGMPKP